MIDFLSAYLEHFSYSALFLFVIASSVGLPFPEEVLFFLSGYLASLGVTNVLAAIGVGIAAVIAGDNFAFWIGSKRGGEILTHLEYHVPGSGKFFQRAIRFFELFSSPAVFFSRFLPGIRFFIPYIAGASRMRWRQFFWWDAAGAVLWVGAATLLSFFFAESLDVLGVLKEIRHIIWAVIGVIILIVFFVRLSRKNH